MKLIAWGQTCQAWPKTAMLLKNWNLGSFSQLCTFICMFIPEFQAIFFFFSHFKPCYSVHRLALASRAIWTLLAISFTFTEYSQIIIHWLCIDISLQSFQIWVTWLWNLRSYIVGSILMELKERTFIYFQCFNLRKVPCT